MTMEEMNNSRRPRLRRLSRQAIFSSQNGVGFVKAAGIFGRNKLPPKGLTRAGMKAQK
jgi:hypothetical protein